MKGYSTAKRADLRRWVLELRSAQSPLEVANRSELICATLRHIPELQRARTVMAYAAIKQEADINEYWLGLRDEGKTVVLPRVNGNDLEAVRFDGWDRTKPGPFGIRELEGEPFPPELIEAVLVPGVVFDRCGYRLGYGKGYYDRFLSQLPATAFFCGIAFELQLVDEVFPTDRDVRMHALVTESRFIRF
mgnify:FL=1